MNRQLKEILEKEGIVTKQLQNQYFKGLGFGRIRQYLAEIGLDPHTCIELDSTEIALVTPRGILMQIRNYDEKGIETLGLWGGALKSGESPEEGATREIKEETGLDLTITLEHFVEIDTHYHEYANGDKALFHAYRYVVTLDYVPEIHTDDESRGAQLVRGFVIDHQREFVKKVLSQKGVKRP